MTETIRGLPETQSNDDTQPNMLSRLDELIDESHDRTKRLIRIRYMLASGQIDEPTAESALDETPGIY